MMTEQLTKPGYVELSGGWTIPLPACTIQKNPDGSFEAWGRDWAIDANVIEVTGDAAGNPLPAEKILGNVDPASKISGNDWIGSKEILHETTDDGSPVTRIVTRFCAQNTVMICTVSFLAEDFRASAEGIVKYVLHKPAAPAKPATAAKPVAPAGGQKITRLTPADQASLVQQRQVLEKYLGNEQSKLKYQHVAGKLGLLRALLDQKIFKPDQSYEYGCMGVVLGDAFVQELKMEWIGVEDDKGRDFAIRVPNTSIVIYPVGMILKRVLRGEQVDVFDLFNGVAGKVDELRKKLG